MAAEGSFFMIQYHVYPGGKKRIVTFSYDDGHPNDERLIEMFNKYGVKGTFHLNAVPDGDAECARLREMYSGHEISCHTLQHGWPDRMPPASLVGEVMKNRAALEKIAGYPVCGMSYPSGAYSREAIGVFRACGIVYSRTVVSNMNFCLPEDFLEWHPTCHHNAALGLCDRFLENLDSQWVHPLFYIWGHSHELRTESDWEMIENILKKLAGNGKIWYATNMEIYRYITAQKMLEISADEKTFFNPTAIDVWVERDKRDIIKIPAGKSVTA